MKALIAVTFTSLLLNAFLIHQSMQIHFSVQNIESAHESLCRTLIDEFREIENYLELIGRESGVSQEELIEVDQRTYDHLINCLSGIYDKTTN